MSAIPTDARLVADAPGERRAGKRVPTRALAYILFVTGLAVAASLPFVIRLSGSTEGWVTFGVLATAAATAQLFVVRTRATRTTTRRSCS